MLALKKSTLSKTIGLRILPALGLVACLTLTATIGAADGTKTKSADVEARSEPAILSRVKLLLKADSPRMEITSTRPIRPVITRIPEPPGLQIDLSNARISVPH